VEHLHHSARVLVRAVAQELEQRGHRRHAGLGKTRRHANWYDYWTGLPDGLFSNQKS
jgi:hypothetical protein